MSSLPSDLYRTLPEDSGPIILPQKLTISRKPKIPSTQTLQENSNGVNGTINGTASKRKRSLDEPDHKEAMSSKRGKLYKNSGDEASVIPDDSSNGAIVIEDD